MRELCQIVVSLLNCELSKLGDDILTRGFVYSSKSLSLIAYRNCLRRNRKYTSTKSLISRCLPLATEICTNAQIRATRVIRISGYMLKTLLDVDPDIKIVHYVRDPRAMFLSQRFGRVPAKALSRGATWAPIWCYRLLEDCRHVRHLAEANDILVITLRRFGHKLHANFTRDLWIHWQGDSGSGYRLVPDKHERDREQRKDGNDTHEFDDGRLYVAPPTPSGRGRRHY